MVPRFFSIGALTLLLASTATADNYPATPKAVAFSAIEALKTGEQKAFAACYDTSAPGSADRMNAYFARVATIRQLQSVAEFRFGTADLNLLPDMDNKTLDAIADAYKAGETVINGDHATLTGKTESGVPTLTLIKHGDTWLIDANTAFAATATEQRQSALEVAAMKEVIVAIKTSQIWSTREARAMLDQKTQVATTEAAGAH